MRLCHPLFFTQSTCISCILTARPTAATWQATDCCTHQSSRQTYPRSRLFVPTWLWFNAKGDILSLHHRHDQEFHRHRLELSGDLLTDGTANQDFGLVSNFITFLFCDLLSFALSSLLSPASCFNNKSRRDLIVQSLMISSDL